MTRLHWDTSEVERFAIDLSEAPGRMQRKAAGVFARGAYEIKGRIRRAALGHDYLPDLPRFVSYDHLGPLHYEIGFDKVGQGNLAVFAVYGSVNNAPVMPTPYALALPELREIERHLANEAEDAVLGGDR